MTVIRIRTAPAASEATASTTAASGTERPWPYTSRAIELIVNPAGTANRCADSTAPVVVARRQVASPTTVAPSGQPMSTQPPSAYWSAASRNR